MATSQDSALRETLLKVRDRIAELRERGDHLSEQDTKAVLIDPVLAALGWRLDELGDVRREYRVKPQDNPVDYALFVYGQPQLFVEAKALSHRLERKSAAQVLGYAAVVGVGWCLVTNGDEYRLYNSHAQVDVDEKLFRSLRFSDPEQTEFSLETLALIAREQMGETALELLWKSQFIDRRVNITLADLFADEDGALARLVHKHSSDLSLADVRESLRRAKIEVHYPELTRAATSAADAAVRAVTPATATLAEAAGDFTVKSPTSPHSYAVELQDLIVAGVVQTPLSLSKVYKGVQLEAVINSDGRVHFAGESYDSLSTAAGMARKSVIGTTDGRSFPQTNGWRFWQYHDAASGELHPINDLRQQFLQRDHA